MEMSSLWHILSGSLLFPCQSTGLGWGEQRMVLKLELSVPFMVSRGQKPLWVINRLGMEHTHPSNNLGF